MSPRDSVAVTLAEARARGTLPDYETCLKMDQALASV